MNFIDKIKENTLLYQSIGNVVLKVFQMILNFIFLILITRYLNQNQIGIYSLYVSIILIVSLPVTNGILSFILREVSIQKKNLQKINHIASSFVVYTLIVAPITGVIGYYYFIYEVDSLDKNLISIAFLSSIILGINTIRSSILKGFGYVFESELPDYFLRPLLLIIIFLIVFLTQSKKVEFFILGYFISTLIALIFGYYIMLKYAPYIRLSVLDFNLSSFEYYKQSIPFLFIGGLQIINSNIDIILLSKMGTLSEVAVYKVIYMLNKSLLFLATSIYLVISPKLAHYWDTENIGDIQRLVSKSTRFTTCIVLPVFCLYFFFSNDILSIFFGNEYTTGSKSLKLLAVGFLVSTLVGPAGELVIMAKHEKIMLKNRLYIMITNIVLDVLLIPIYGIEGAILATVFVYITSSIYISFYCYKNLNIRTDIFNFN